MNTKLAGILATVAVAAFTVAYAVTAWAAGVGGSCCGQCAL